MNNKKKYYFNTRGEAEEALDQIKRIANTYTYVSVADVADICGLSSSYKDNKLGWFESTLSDVYVTRCSDCYCITLPRPIPSGTDYPPKVTYREYSAAKKPTITPEPLCITIHTKDVDDIDATLAETFKYIYTIKDRMVNLTIM